MKFKFRLEAVKRHRKIEQDVAQREYSDAQLAVRKQLAIIKRLYEDIDVARKDIEVFQTKGGACMSEIISYEQFIEGQKIVITNARQVARDLMQIEEEKLEILSEKMKNLKILEKLKDKQKEEFKIAKNKKIQKSIDDIVTMRFKPEVGT